MGDYIAGKMSDIFGGGNTTRPKPRPKIRKRIRRPFSRGGLRCMVRIIVPSTQNVTHPISNAAFMHRIAEVRRELSVMFGGYTSVQATGGWVESKSKKLIRERAAIVTANSTVTDYRKNIGKLSGYVKRIKKKWGQATISVVVETPTRPSETLYFH